MMIGSSNNNNPPLLHHYGELLCHYRHTFTNNLSETNISIPREGGRSEKDDEKCQLPLIDLSPLMRNNNNNNNNKNDKSIRACVAAIARAASEWGFFQVVNHGVKPELLQRMRREQVKLFEAPFEKKAGSGLLNNCYRWGTPTATCPSQFSWSEAFHVPLAKISEEACSGGFASLRTTLEEYAAAMSTLARTLAGVLVSHMNKNEEEEPPLLSLKGVCGEDDGACFLRLNRYPPCEVSPEIFGLVPHTDSDFLTILHQDQVGGLQLNKDSKWAAVEPIQGALIVNVGDMFQAWSNDEYRSVEHKVMVNEKVERYSIAYFLCPSNDSVIGSCRQPSIYRNFTFGEYRAQVQEDVKRTGYKVGLPRFLV